MSYTHVHHHYHRYLRLFEKRTRDDSTRFRITTRS